MSGTAGYSGTPLHRKLGFREGQRAALVNALDTKVCAIDATWSGLRLVVRRELR